MTNFSRSALDAAVALFEQEHLQGITLTEGVDDPGILKCVFMAGGSGSGKTTVASDLLGIDADVKSSFSTFGLKLVNSDTSFSYLIKKMGYDPTKLAQYAKTDPALYDKLTSDAKDSVRSRAKEIMLKQRALYMGGRLGIIVDGTGDKAKKMADAKSQAEDFGYDCFLIFVNTPLEVAMERNRRRGEQGERVMEDSVVREIWHNVQQQIPALRNIFGSNMVVVEGGTTTGGSGSKPLRDREAAFQSKIAADVHQAVRAFVAAPIRNPIGREWVLIQKAAEELKS